MKLETPVPGGKSTQREHLKLAVPNHIWLQPFEMSNYDHYIMAVFWQLCRERSGNLDGTPRGLSLQSFVYYQQLFNDVLNTDEIELLQSIDASYMSAIADLRKEE